MKARLPADPRVRALLGAGAVVLGFTVMLGVEAG
jgi:hypothetical protein